MIAINVYFGIHLVVNEMAHDWYFLLPVTLFAIFYILMCSYLIFHAFLSMSGHAYFKNSNVSKSLCENATKFNSYGSILSYLFNKHCLYDKFGMYCENATESERLLDLSDSDEKDINLNHFIVES